MSYNINVATNNITILVPAVNTTILVPANNIAILAPGGNITILVPVNNIAILVPATQGPAGPAGPTGPTGPTGPPGSTTPQTITLTGDVTGSGTGSFPATIAAGAVTLAKMANMATGSLIYRKTAGTGVPQVNTLATLKTDLGLTGTNSGDQTIANTSDATSHTVTLSSSGGTVKLVEGTGITLTTTGTSSAGVVTIASTGGGGGGGVSGVTGPGVNNTNPANPVVNARPYKVYTAILTQEGFESDPIAEVLENTLGGTITWTWSETGVCYGIESSGSLVANTTFLSVGSMFITGTEAYPFSTTSALILAGTIGFTVLYLRTYFDGSPTDQWTAHVEIRNYN